MGFFDDLIDIAKSVGEVSNEFKGLKKDVLSSFDGVKSDAKKLIETAKGNDVPEENSETGVESESKAEAPDAE